MTKAPYKDLWSSNKTKMNIKKNTNGLEVNVDSGEIIDHFLNLALKQIKNKKRYKYSTAYVKSFRIDIRFIETFPRSYLSKRKTMLEKAKKIKITDFIEEFRSTSNKENRFSVAQFCNSFKYCEDQLDRLITEDKKRIFDLARVGPQTLDLFEEFLKNKGFEFGIWDGEKFV